METNKIASIGDGMNKVNKGKESPDLEIPVQTFTENPAVVTDAQIDGNGIVIETGEGNNVQSPADDRAKVIPCWKKYIGIIFAVIGSIVTALGIVMVKVLVKNDNNTEYGYDPITVAAWRCQGIFWPSLITLLVCQFILKQNVLEAFKPIKDREKWIKMTFLLFRAIFGMIAVILRYYSIRKMDAGDSTVISSSTPVFVTLVANIFLGESCGIIPVACAVLSLCGVAVIVRPPFLTGESELNSETLIGAAYAFVSMLCLTLVFVLLRRIKDVHYAVITTVFGFLSSIACYILTLLPMIPNFEFPRKWQHWLLAGALCLCAFVGQFCVTLALRFEKAGPVSVVRTLDVMFVFIWQFAIIFPHTPPDEFSYVGATITIIAVLICGFRKWVEDLPEDNATRKKLSFLLF